jgi:polyhydroxybutyrate depolymerase
MSGETATDSTTTGSRDMHGLRLWLPTLAVLCAVVTAAGCQASRIRDDGPLGAGRHDRSVRVDGQERRYRVYVPTTRDKPAPMILALHGAAGTVEHFEGLTDLDKVAGGAGFVVAYLAGIRRTWNAGGGCCNPAARLGVDDVSFIRTVIDDVASGVAIDRRRVFATGFSNGALMAYRLACDAADRIAAIVSVAGAMTLPQDQCRSARPVPILQIHGDADRFAPLRGGPSPLPLVPAQPSVLGTLAYWASSNGCRMERRGEDSQGRVRTIRYTECADNADVEGVIVVGLGHQWPGAARRYSPRVLGPQTRYVSASERAVRFFSRHALPPSG